MRYYKPTPEELLNSKQDLLLEIYDVGEKSWTPFTYDSSKHLGVPLDDLRIKYLMAEDFNSVGYITRKIFLGKQTQIKDILMDGTEITEEIDVWDDEVLTIYKGGSPKGFFYPYKPTNNVVLEESKYSIKNVTELKRLIIWKQSQL